MEHIKTDSKLWIIGDSFTGNRHENDSWTLLLYKSFLGDDMYCSSDSSRDVQTIIDIFLKNLHNIKPNDFVILMLPTIARYRLPLAKPQWDVESCGNDKKRHEYYRKIFIGSGAYVPENEKNPLEYPLDTVPSEFLLFDNNHPRYSQTSFASISTMINSSNASLRNYNQIFNSFKNYFPFKLKIYSWTDELDDSIVQTKKIITQKCSEWHTLADVWNETDGKDGMRDDLHWSKRMDKIFANMVIKENPKYFN